ncbi:TIGR04283 family arsenosugar biosynthesis glycosyltransferase [Egbenema bharatensis]|uniref:TIGR04283 family arsenosugar biosynthesis glycosyltransferase n=1 Tax=Egbenema bharatensis TaxID=3463334 RepID=UPI003A84A7A9
MTVYVSIIIPTLNEATTLNQTLQCLTTLDPPAQEILIVDGGSQDNTIALAEAATFTQTTLQILTSQQAGRSVQMNCGAKQATGEVLCFLHADTLVPPDLVTVIDKTLADPSVVCGGFISLMAGTDTTRWSISLHNYLKTYYAPLLFRPHLFLFKGLRLLFGDQVMFCRSQSFWNCGGFDPALPIMEEADLCRKLVQQGRIRLVNRVVQSSDRRVAKWGLLKANLIYLYVGFLWGIGVSANYLKQFYEDIR